MRIVFIKRVVHYLNDSFYFLLIPLIPKIMVQGQASTA